MTKVKFNDNRKTTAPIFDDIEVGAMFTEVEGETIYMKLDNIQIHYCEEKTSNSYHADSMVYNAIDISDGEFVSFDDNEEIHPIQELEIVIKK